ncbi:DUF3343 domain-containing protein [Peptostreptococcus russellii]|uniref:Putative Se/S carrier protein-like domain-containing protein n=1 Tax=Peptostreptococcus russellii TaxID=215200 RepID=A0A1H8KVV2_9FIRM|nr:DUF3343 domain-containing protein [Peptostreptococcus russellii]MBC2576954.1 DUF3343 domain-containing protein [Peptostreptococcus russellii]SEN96538.1 Protein of unknown function [Peptostreptococcus russellii]
MNDFYVISFNSTHHAIRTEKLLLEEGMKIMTLPTPREIAASCGLSIKFELDDLEKVNIIMKENSLERRGIFHITKDDSGERVAIKIED